MSYDNDDDDKSSEYLDRMNQEGRVDPEYPGQSSFFDRPDDHLVTYESVTGRSAFGNGIEKKLRENQRRAMATDPRTLGMLPPLMDPLKYTPPEIEEWRKVLREYWWKSLYGVKTMASKLAEALRVVHVGRSQTICKEELDGTQRYRRPGGRWTKELPVTVELAAGLPGTPLDFSEFLPHLTWAARLEVHLSDIENEHWNAAHAAKKANQPEPEKLSLGQTVRELCRRLTREGFDVTEDAVRRRLSRLREKVSGKKGGTPE
jgi:hypothetical protein